MSWKSKLPARSRDTRWLLHVSLAILIASGVFSVLLKRIGDHQGWTDWGTVEELSKHGGPEGVRGARDIQRGKPATREGLATIIRFRSKNGIARFLMQGGNLAELARHRDDHLNFLGQAIDASPLTSQEKSLFSDFAAALLDVNETGTAAAERIGLLANQPDSPPRYAREFRADLLRRSGGHAEAQLSTAMRRNFEDAAWPRKRVLEHTIGAGETAEALELLAMPGYRDVLDPIHGTEIAALARDFPELMRAVLRLEIRSFRSLSVVVSLLSGLIWFVILTKFLGRTRRRFLLCLAAVLLGIVSAYATLVAVIWQDRVMGSSLTGELVGDLLYCVSGIGLREELLKFLCAVPLVIVLARRRSQVEMLIVSACVGLGFAISENTGSYSEFEGWGRFLTASFLHISLTGLLGLAFGRFLMWPKTRWEEFIATFIGVVLAHGMYDALLLANALAHYSFLSIVVFGGVVYAFFHRLAEVREHNPQAISPLAVFVLGSAVLASLLWIFLHWEFPFRIALQNWGNAFFGIAIMAFIYINQFRDE